MRRVRPGVVRTLSEEFAEVDPGCLLRGDGPARLQDIWESSAVDSPITHRFKRTRWIY